MDRLLGLYLEETLRLTGRKLHTCAVDSKADRTEQETDPATHSVHCELAGLSALTRHQSNIILIPLMNTDAQLLSKTKSNQGQLRIKVPCSKSSRMHGKSGKLDRPGAGACLSFPHLQPLIYHTLGMQ